MEPTKLLLYSYPTFVLLYFLDTTRVAVIVKSSQVVKLERSQHFGDHLTNTVSVLIKILSGPLQI